MLKWKKIYRYNSGEQPAAWDLLYCVNRNYLKEDRLNQLALVQEIELEPWFIILWLDNNDVGHYHGGFIKHFNLVRRNSKNMIMTWL